MNAKKEEEVAARIEWEKREDAIDAIKKVISREIAPRDLTVDQVQNLLTHQEVLQDQTEEESTEKIEREAIAVQDQAAQIVIEEEVEAEISQQGLKKFPDLHQDLFIRERDLSHLEEEARVLYQGLIPLQRRLWRILIQKLIMRKSESEE